MKITYIGTKVVQGEPMMYNDFLTERGRETVEEDAPGFKVWYEDGYVSWSPHAPFIRCYREITHQEADMVCSIEKVKMGRLIVCRICKHEIMPGPQGVPKICNVCKEKQKKK